jgi:hypothetical protein
VYGIIVTWESAAIQKRRRGPLTAIKTGRENFTMFGGLVLQQNLFGAVLTDNKKGSLLRFIMQTSLEFRIPSEKWIGRNASSKKDCVPKFNSCHYPQFWK